MQTINKINKEIVLADTLQCFYPSGTMSHVDTYYVVQCLWNIHPSYIQKTLNILETTV